MTYNPTPANAIGAYMTAAADAYRVPEDFIDRPNQAHIEETTRGNFRIHASQRNNDQGRSFPDIAVCFYDEQTHLWTVKLNTGEMMQVRHDSNGFAVVTE
jgi:hypothetical protein